MYVWAAAAVLVFSCAGAAQAGDAVSSGVEDPPVIERARDYVAGFFEPLNGTVTAVEDGRVMVRLEGGKRVGKGVRLSVFRAGSPFYHPVTNEVIGSTETLAGRIEAGETAADGSLRCALLKGDARKGDTARITSSRIRLAFFQDRKADWERSEELYGSLKGAGRFELLEVYTPLSGIADLAAAAREAGAEAFLVFSTPVRDRKMFLNLRLYWADDAGMFGEFEEAGGAPAGVSSKAVAGFLSADITSSWQLAGYQIKYGQLIAIGDVDGGGSDEIVISDGADIRIYDLKKDGLNEKWLIRGLPSERQLSIDVLDLNNNGVAEIFVTSRSGSGISSYVIEYGPSGYARVRDRMPYYLRAAGGMLLMQKASRFRPFSAPVLEAEWKGGDYVEGRPLDLPAGVNIFGFDYIDWQNSGAPQLVSYDDEGHLTLYDSAGSPLWKSGANYGIIESVSAAARSMSSSEEGGLVLRGGVQTVRTARGSELVVIKRIPNVPVMPGLGFKGWEVYALWWNGSSMEERLIMKDIPGTVTDYRVSGGRMYLFVKDSMGKFLSNAFSGEFYKGSVLYHYDFGVK